MFNAKELSNRCRDNRHGEVDQAMKSLSDEGRGGGSVQRSNGRERRCKRGNDMMAWGGEAL